MSDETQADGVTPSATADVVANGPNERGTRHTSTRLRWAAGLGTALLLVAAVIIVLTRSSNGAPSTGPTPPAVAPADTANTATERPVPSNAPTPDPAHPFIGRDPIPNVDPEQLMRDFSTAWGLSFDIFPNPSGSRRIALKVDETTTRAIQVNMGVDLNNNLRTITCRAGARTEEPLADTNRRFLLDCASRAAGPAAEAVTTWLDNAISRRDPATSETDLRTIMATASGLTLELSYDSLFLTFRIYVPTP